MASFDESRALQRAFALLESGDMRGAQRTADDGLARGRQRAAWLTVLAIALSRDGRAEQALEHFRALCALEPGVAEHWSNLGNCLCELHREVEALAPLERALALGADDPGTHFALARALIQTGAATRARGHIERARAQLPRELEFALLHARILIANETAEPARQLMNRLHEAPLDAGQLAELGYLELRTGEVDSARASFERSLAAQPDNADAAAGLGLALERSNEVDKAREIQSSIRAILTGTPAERLRANLLQLEARLAHRSDDHARTQSALRELLALPGGDPLVRAGLLFELGRSLDLTRDVDAAMAAFGQAHAERREQVLAAIPELGDTDLFEILAHDSAAPPMPAVASSAASTPLAAVDPVFLVGFPRSGTTLLEQLLDAHEGLASFDEQPFLQKLIERIGELGLSYPEGLPRVTAPMGAELRRYYFEQVATAVPALGARRAVDKNPLNMVRLPLVRALFPGAHVLLALRHPCDVVLSCYMQNFRAPAFSLTFESLERAAQMYDRVMAHWRRVSADARVPIHVLRYEDLVADVRGTAMALFEFLGLPWNDQLLEFTQRAQSRGAISTPSYSEVVKPVNAKAVGRWQRYRRHFEGAPLRILAPWIEAYGYAVE